MSCLRKAIRQIRTGFWKKLYFTSSHIDACAWVFGQKQNRNHDSTTVYTGLGSRWLLPLRKTEDTDERKAFCNDWEDKRKIETRAVGDTRKRVSEMFRGLEKSLTWV